MKQIVMLVGIGNNDRGSARLASKCGRVVLIQRAYVEHIEIWENGQRVYDGPELEAKGYRVADELTFGGITMLQNLGLYQRSVETKRTDLIISSAYSQTFAALLLRAIGRTRKVVCIISDYLPPKGKLTVRIHRRISGFLTRVAARFSDEVWAVSPRIPTTKVNPRNFVLPLFIDDNQTAPLERNEIGYIGFPSPDHAIDVLFEICRKHGFRLNLFGDSPYLQSIRHLAPPGAVFHGITNDNAKIGQTLSRCFCGYAVYRDTSPNSYSYYGIPSKMLQFFASNTPVVSTNTAHFTQNVEKYGVGRVVEPMPEQIEKAVLDLKAHYADYSAAINRFRKTWNAEVERFHHERITALLNE
jgi:glycosyltransferase involved in cell wall biosynthesis